MLTYQTIANKYGLFGFWTLSACYFSLIIVIVVYSLPLQC